MKLFYIWTTKPCYLVSLSIHMLVFITRYSLRYLSVKKNIYFIQLNLHQDLTKKNAVSNRSKKTLGLNFRPPSAVCFRELYSAVDVHRLSTLLTHLKEKASGWRWGLGFASEESENPLPRL